MENKQQLVIDVETAQQIVTELSKAPYEYVYRVIPLLLQLKPAVEEKAEVESDLDAEVIDIS